MTTTIKREISDDLIRNLLCCAFEGGSNYWYEIVRAKMPPGATAADYERGGKFQPDSGDHWTRIYIIPLQDGGSLTIKSHENDEHGGAKRWTLNRETITRGLQVMAEKYPQHFADAISENDDATTGDVFLQCCLFGELVYG